MIDLYTWTTPNGRKVSILLEELGVDYAAHAIDITNGDQFDPEFLKIAPNNRIPAIVDHDTGLHMMETGAIMMYLAEKHGKFMPNGDERWRAIEWLMWQMGGLGPMLGQVHHFRGMDEPDEYGVERYTKETHRLYGVLDRRLTDNAYVAGDEYSIADIAILPWAHRHPRHSTDLNDYPNVKRWYDVLWDRPAVKKGMPTLGGINM